MSDGFGFELEITPPVSGLVRMYSEIANRVDDMRPFWSSLENLVGRGLVENLDTRGSSIGANWPEPHAGYSRRKGLEGFGSKPLVRTGALRSALGGADLLEGKKDAAEFGISGPQAEKANALARYPVAGWSERMVTNAFRMLDRFVDEILEDGVSSMMRAG